MNRKVALYTFLFTPTGTVTAIVSTHRYAVRLLSVWAPREKNDCQRMDDVKKGRSSDDFECYEGIWGYVVPWAWLAHGLGARRQAQAM